MAYVIPTPAQFKVVVPKFAGVDDAVIAAVIQQALLFVNTTWLERDYPFAIIYLTAHLLEVTGASEAAPSGGGGFLDDPATFVSMIAFGERRVQFRKRTSGTSELAVASGDYDTTIWGALFLQLRRRNFPAIAIV